MLHQSKSDSGIVGIIAGATIQSAVSGRRIVISGNDLIAYDAGGNAVFEASGGMSFGYLNTNVIGVNSIVVNNQFQVGGNYPMIKGYNAVLSISGQFGALAEMNSNGFDTPGAYKVGGSTVIDSSRNWNGAVISSSYLGSHNHSGGDITSGTVAAARLATHSHAGADIDSGTINNARLPSAISVSSVATSGDVNATGNVTAANCWGSTSIGAGNETLSEADIHAIKAHVGI